MDEGSEKNKAKQTQFNYPLQMSGKKRRVPGTRLQFLDGQKML
jgi:hypothetical protein